MTEEVDPALEQFIDRQVRATGRLSQILVGSHAEGYLALGSLVELVDAGPREGVRAWVLEAGELPPATEADVALSESPANAEEAEVVDELRREMRSEIASLRSELTDQRKELNAEITRTRTEILEVLKSIQSDFNAFRAEVRTDLDRLKESDTSRRVEISDLRGDLKSIDSQFRNELTDLRGELKVLNARITTATAIIVGAVTIAGTIIGILGAVGVFS